jgi:uncharacterized membrane protein
MAIGTKKSSARNQRTDHMLAFVLTAGGLLAFVLTLVGTGMEFLHVSHARTVLQVGILVLMSTPVMRVALSVFAFWKEGDHKYMLIALAVLVIVLLGAIMRVAV